MCDNASSHSAYPNLTVAFTAVSALVSLHVYLLVHFSTTRKGDESPQRQKMIRRGDQGENGWERVRLSDIRSLGLSMVGKAEGEGDLLTA